ncbi:MAG: 2,3-bisphosphoglycerate-independent phosphoglycerate mutase, partial [Candidatus Methanofastidiosia archaeon]
MSHVKLALIILDGWGLRDEKEGNAIALAKTPNMDLYLKKYPSTVLEASGKAVGLPEGVMGNSEVGHLNLGAGRIVYQDLMRIDEAIRNSPFSKNKAILKAMKNAKRENSKLHLLGLLSDGGVHSHINQLYALMKVARNYNLKTFIHGILDGRDTPPTSALKFIEDLENFMREEGIGELSTLIGRYYGMDRDSRWERTKLAYDALVFGKGIRAVSAREALKMAYEKGETDEFVKPIIFGERIENEDSTIFFNFREDRMRQLVKAFAEPGFSEFKVKKLQICLVTMTRYYREMKIPVAFEPNYVSKTLGEVLSKFGFTQLRIAETEKYAHVTYFFNGGREEVFKGEERILIPSPKVATYDKKPEMSAFDVTEEVVERIESNEYEFIVLNYANPDMVGHTGSLKAAIQAIETVDHCLSKVVDALLGVKSYVLITSDHGNAEEMFYPDGTPHTTHTKNPVPFILVGKEEKLRKGILADVAPTIL